MRRSSIALRLSLLAVIGLGVGCGQDAPPTPHVVPHPRAIEVTGQPVSLGDGFSLVVEDPELEPLRGILDRDLQMLSDLPVQAAPQAPVVRLALDGELGAEEYHLRVDDAVSVTGGSYGAVSMGLVTLLQAMDENLSVPGLDVRDQPEMSYRGVMLDLARAWHDVGTLREVIELCRWYKINFLHLHLTDDQSFTFPSEAFPRLATEGRSYTLQELRDLDRYAYERGVTLVPELDVPGHATQFVRKMPELFGIGDPSRNSFTISMGKEEVYDALDVLVGELSDVFSHSPYIHIGGDEAFFAGMEDDPETRAFMETTGLSTLDGLFRYFLGRVNDMVRDRGRETIVWAGFAEEGEREIPRDIIVMHWESQYYDPQTLIDDGFQVINASFKPLYVVNNRKWDPEYIRNQWNPRRWESWAHDGDDFVGIEVGPTDQLIGASMSAWEQDQTNQVSRLRSRVPSMSEHLWNPVRAAREGFPESLARTDARFGALLRPFQVVDAGMAIPDPGEGLFLEHRGFGAAAQMTVLPRRDDLTFRYSMDGDPVTPDSPSLDGPLRIERSAEVVVQAFDAEGVEVGTPYHQRYLLRPLSLRPEGIWKPLPTGSWEKHRFLDRMSVVVESSSPDLRVHYTLDGSAPALDGPEYSEAFTLERTTTVRAQAFGMDGERVGQGVSETYYVIIEQPSLTTGKRTWATNEKIRPGLAALATNGRVTLWEQWGGHVGEEVWIAVDLDQVEPVRRFQVQNFWDGYRYYQYTIDGSMDGEEWTQLVDFSDNTEVATIDGYVHEIEPASVRYVRINLLYNSANPGLHLVEFGAFR